MGATSSKSTKSYQLVLLEQKKCMDQCLGSLVLEGSIFTLTRLELDF